MCYFDENFGYILNIRKPFPRKYKYILKPLCRTGLIFYSKENFLDYMKNNLEKSRKVEQDLSYLFDNCYLTLDYFSAEINISPKNTKTLFNKLCDLWKTTYDKFKFSWTLLKSKWKTR